MHVRKGWIVAVVRKPVHLYVVCSLLTTLTTMVCVKSFSLPTVLTIAPKRLFSESTMTLLCPLTIKNLLFWFYWTCLLLLIQLIILFSLLDYLPVLAFVTRHWTGFVHIYLIALSMSTCDQNGVRDGYEKKKVFKGTDLHDVVYVPKM